jgi:hypothetical protein
VSFAKVQDKTMLITFFDKQGVIHKEFVPERQIVNSAFYVEVIGRLLKRISLGEATISSRGQLGLVAGQCPFPFHTGNEDISGQARCCGDKPPTLFS